MFLQEFLNNIEEDRARRRVQDHLRSDLDGTSRAEFLGHFLSSVFQPIFQKENRSLVTIGYEAFIRPVAGDPQFSPKKYFDELARNDQSFADQLCRDLHLSNFGRLAHDGEFISINIVPDVLQDHTQNFEDLELQLLSAKSELSKTNPMMIEIDITPELDAGIIYTFATQLRLLGTGIVLENFDCDCASFSRIVHCRPDVVKFSRSWLDANLLDPNYIDMVVGVVQGLHALGAKAHLERIETREELLFAIAAGFDRFQGYYLGKPERELKRTRQMINL